MELLHILSKHQMGHKKEAEEDLLLFLQHKKDLRLSSRLRNVQIREDYISLNSLNGILTLEDESRLFFKFHREGGQSTAVEYYNAQELTQQGFPCVAPVYLSKESGNEILIYPYIEADRLFDVCAQLERSDPNLETSLAQQVIRSQQALDRLCGEIYLRSLHQAEAGDLAKEPLVQLFYRRLVDEDGRYPGARLKGYYGSGDFIFPNDLQLAPERLLGMRWVINGMEYGQTLQECFDQAYDLLNPARYVSYAAVVGHGDAHNGNVWFHQEEERLSLFDPAFAGAHLPALWAEIKPTFHNIFAHPDWLYDPAEATKILQAEAKVSGNRLIVNHNWKLPKLREEFLQSKVDLIWIPLLKELRKRNGLPQNWQLVMRSALFCCPTLVMNLRCGLKAGTAQNRHTPQTSLLGLSIALMLGSAPASSEDRDVVTSFFNQLNQNLET